MWWIFGSITVLMITTALIVPIRVLVEYERRTPEDDHFRILVRLAGPLRLKLDVSMLDWSPGKGVTGRLGVNNGKLKHTERITLQKLIEELRIPESQLHSLLTIVDVFQTVLFGKNPNDDEGRSLGSPLLHLLHAPLIFLRYTRVLERWEWETRLGTGEAAATALLIPTLWSAKSIAFAVATQWMRIETTPRFQVVPDFERALLELRFLCIFRYRLGEIMLVTLAQIVRKWQKGAVHLGFGKGSSH